MSNAAAFDGLASYARASGCSLQYAFGTPEVNDKSCNDDLPQHSSSQQRRAEFRAGRALSRKAMSELGHAPVSIGQDRAGAPVWPVGLCGSITHCKGCIAAVVTRTKFYHGIGLDVERLDILDLSIAPRLLLPCEQNTIFGLSRVAAQRWLQIAFSAKEAFYKATYPLLGQFPDFTEARVTAIDKPSGFSGRLRVARVGGGSLGSVDGRWVLSGDFVMVLLTHHSPPSLQLTNHICGDGLAGFE